MNEVALRVHNLGKQYRLGPQQEANGAFRYKSLRDVVTHTAQRCVRAGRPSARDCKRSIINVDEAFWALAGVSFEVKRGDVVGVIGRNGAGKSTLLKILSRITPPTTGKVEIAGHVGSLLEVGTGFHPELTGQENIFLNGAVLGMKRAHIRRHLEEIIAFAEVERFTDTPVKHYSTGMYLRLAFAVAAHLNPDILIVDEVLAVGDAQFQKKCLGKMKEVSTAGRTVLFVSHNMAAVKKLCGRCLLLKSGRLANYGETDAIVAEYLGTGQDSTGRLDVSGRLGQPHVAFVRNAWIEKNATATDALVFGDEADIVMEIQVVQPATLSFELVLRQSDGIPVAFAPSGLAQDISVNSTPGPLWVRARLPPARLAAGKYTVDLIVAETGIRFLDYVESGLTFRIDSAAVGPRNWAFTQARGQGHELWDVHYQVESRECDLVELGRCIDR